MSLRALYQLSPMRCAPASLGCTQSSASCGSEFVHRSATNTGDWSLDSEEAQAGTARVGRVLRLEVTDDGLGADADAGRLSDLEQGVGVSNIRARLADLYGPRHRFAVSSPRAGGLSVQIELPID